MLPLVRWIIGDVQPDGYECLQRSIAAFRNLYEAELVICHNCDPAKLPLIEGCRLIDQRSYLDDRPEPLGVAWKLYPPRLAPGRHEILIDNDLILEEPVPEIDQFLSDDCTLLLQGIGRTYGRFDRHVPPGYEINSGIYGMPPGFDLGRFVQMFVGDGWEKNALGEHDQNETFDEQGLVAMALSSYPRSVIIPRSAVPECSKHLIDGQGRHFIGLNRWRFHRPYRLYRSKQQKLFL